MTVTFIHILISLALVVAGATAGALYSRSKKPKQPLPDHKKELDQVQKSIHQLELRAEKLELQATEMKEFVTRSMNRMSARSSKLDKNQETWEQMQALLEQSKEIDTNGHHDDRIEPNPTNFPRKGRLVRVAKGDV